MISQERFNEIELEHNCGYWNICAEHSCPCAITTENKGLRQDIWNDFIKENEELANEYEDYNFNSLERCSECGCLFEEDDLIDGMCF